MITTCKSQNPDFCTYHYTLAIKQQLDYAKALYRQAKGRSALVEAQKDIDRLNRLYNSTPEGIKKIKTQITEAKSHGDNFPLILEEKLRIAKLDFSYRKMEHEIKIFENSKRKLQPEDVRKLFRHSKYILSATTNKKNYLELYNSTKEYNKNNVIATVKKTKGGWLITSKTNLNEPNIAAQVVGSSDGVFGDIISVKKSLVFLRREIEKNKNKYNHGKYILSDTKKYRLLVLSQTILFNTVPQKHYIIYSNKHIPFAIYRVDSNGMFVEGHIAQGNEKTELVQDAWSFREWVYHYKDTERRLPKSIIS